MTGTLTVPLSVHTLRPRDANLTEGLVDDTPLKSFNPLGRRDYLKVGSNSTFVVQPSIVHFGGYDVNSVHRTTVRIINQSATSQRITLLTPNTPFFKATCDKKGWIAPGMAEVVKLEFCPTEWRYYYDCLRIHSDGENLLVPIHAYPVINDVLFPVRVDFGRCVLNEEYTRTVKLECKVPIQFEYSVEAADTAAEGELAAISVSPTHGVLPADGYTEVTFTFRPTKLVTYSAQFKVNVSQFNSEAVTCTVTGSAAPCKVRDEWAEQRGTMPGIGPFNEQFQRFAGLERPTMQELEGQEIMGPPFRVGAGGQSRSYAGGGSGHGDAYTRALAVEMKDIRAAQRPPGPIQTREPSLPPPVEEIPFRGVMVHPELVGTQSGVQAVLLQQQGKLRMKDLHKAVEENNRLREEQNSSMKLGASKGLGWIDDDEMTQQIKEMIFQQEFNALCDYEREVELKFGQALGGVPPTQQEVDYVQSVRAETQANRDAKAKYDAQHRYAMEPTTDRASHVAHQEPIEGFVPDFDIYKNRDFDRRKQCVDRFRRTAMLVIVRNRAEYRLKLLKDMLRRCGFDKRKVRAAVNEVFLGVKDVGQSDHIYMPPDFDPTLLREHVFPMFLDSNFRDRAPVAGCQPVDSEVWTPLPAHEPLRFLLQPYEAHPFPAFAEYVEPRADQPLMAGAEEEEEDLTPVDVLPTVDEQPRMPEEFTRPVRAPYPHLSERMSDDLVMAPPFPMWGMQDPYRIQPAQFAFVDTIRHEAEGANSLHALGNSELMSSLWLPRRENWLMERPYLPALLKGAAKADLMPQDSGFEAQPHVKRVVRELPTEESIKAMYFVPAAGDAVPPAVREAREAAAAAATTTTTTEQSTAGVTNQGTSGATRADEYEIPRTRKEVELDRRKREARDSWLEHTLKQRELFNSLVNDPQNEIDVHRPTYPPLPSL